MNLNTEIYMYRGLSFKRIMSLEKKKTLTSDWLDLVKEVGRFLIMLSVLHTHRSKPALYNDLLYMYPRMNRYNIEMMRYVKK